MHIENPAAEQATIEKITLSIPVPPFCASLR
jgi:hypothetical protein